MDDEKTVFRIGVGSGEGANYKERIADARVDAEWSVPLAQMLRMCSPQDELTFFIGYGPSFHFSEPINIEDWEVGYQ